MSPKIKVLQVGFFPYVGLDILKFFFSFFCSKVLEAVGTVSWSHACLCNSPSKWILRSLKVCVCVCVCVYWLRKVRVKMVKHLTSSSSSSSSSTTFHGLSLCCPSDAGDGGQAVGWLLELLRLCGGGFWDGAKAEGQSDTTRADVAGAQRWILPPIAFHDAGCVGRKAFTRSAQETTESQVVAFKKARKTSHSVCLLNK